MRVCVSVCICILLFMYVCAAAFGVFLVLKAGLLGVGDRLRKGFLEFDLCHCHCPLSFYFVGCCGFGFTYACIPLPYLTFPASPTYLSIYAGHVLNQLPDHTRTYTLFTYIGS